MIGQHIKSFIRSSFRALGVDIHKVHEHDRNRLTWLKEHNIRTIIDVGGNVGQFAGEAFRTFPGAKVYSFEPLKETYRQLVAAHSGKKHVVFNVALGDHNGKTMIKKSMFSASSSLLEMGELHKEVFPFTADISDEEISVKRLDDVVREGTLDLEPGLLIKLDVQGYEDKVIRGGAETFKRAKIVVCEVSFKELYKGQALFDVIYGSLKDMGYSFKGSLQTFYHPKTGMPLYCDAAFIRER